MRRVGAYLVVLAVLIVAQACGPRKIPRDEMEDILAEMLLQDQQIKINREMRIQADTSLIYEGIFQAYGYNTDDFIYSLSYYMEDASRMEKIMGNVAEQLEKEAKAVGKELDHLHWIERMMSIYQMLPDTTLPHPYPFILDTLPLRFSPDSSWVKGPENPWDEVPADSLLFLRDSLYFQRDSL